MRSSTRVMAGGLAAIVMAVGALGCDDNDSASDNLERAGDKVERATEKAADNIEDAADKAADKVKDATD